MRDQENYDERLTAGDVLQSWQLDADLVTLSACQTGLGREAGGEGYLGFTQAMFYAGARSVLVSLWKVDDAATALLMTRFYQNLLGKRKELKGPMAKAEALREAKHWLRSLNGSEVEMLRANLWAQAGRPLPQLARGSTDESERRPFAHPYYWSAFILIGRRFRVSRPATRRFVCQEGRACDRDYGRVLIACRRASDTNGSAAASAQLLETLDHNPFLLPGLHVLLDRVERNAARPADLDPGPSPQSLAVSIHQENEHGLTAYARP